VRIGERQMWRMHGKKGALHSIPQSHLHCKFSPGERREYSGTRTWQPLQVYCKFSPGEESAGSTRFRQPLDMACQGVPVRNVNPLVPCYLICTANLARERSVVGSHVITPPRGIPVKKVICK